MKTQLKQKSDKKKVSKVCTEFHYRSRAVDRKRREKNAKRRNGSGLLIVWWTERKFGFSLFLSIKKTQFLKPSFEMSVPVGKAQHFFTLLQKRRLLFPAIAKKITKKWTQLHIFNLDIRRWRKFGKPSNQVESIDSYPPLPPPTDSDPHFYWSDWTMIKLEFGLDGRFQTLLSIRVV